MSMQKGTKNGQNAQFRIHMWKAEKISWLWPRVALSWKIFGSKHLVMIKMTFKYMVASYSEPIIGKQENQVKWGSDGPMRRSCHGYLCYSTPGYHSTLDASIYPPGHVPFFFYLSFSLILFSLHFRLLYFLPSALFSHHNLIFPVARH